MAGWTAVRRARAALTLVLVLLVAGLLFTARRALMPLAVGTLVAYIMLPLIDWFDAHIRPAFRKRQFVRSAMVLVVYLLSLAVIAGFLASIIPPIGAQLQVLLKRLPDLAASVQRVAPEVVQNLLERYNELVPANIRLAVQRSFDNTVQALADSIQTGALKAVNVVLTTLSYMVGLLVVPLWMFYVLRDRPEMTAAFYRLIPLPLRDDTRHILLLIDGLLGSYLRGQLILCFAVGTATTIGLSILGIDLALLLGAIAGVLEIVPVLGPILGAVPAVLVTLASSPQRLLWVIGLAVVVQQLENYVLVPQISHGSMRIPPAISILVLIVGSEVGGVLGAILSLPLTAMVRDISHYLYLRLDDHPLSPSDAVAQVRTAPLSPLPMLRRAFSRFVRPRE
ncbi:MAG TPA: AI-2E family transporter [Anaerolineae bacterium]|nr:AI-2E family transporter [Anaerolineae bacterium]